MLAYNFVNIFHYFSLMVHR